MPEYKIGITGWMVVFMAKKLVIVGGGHASLPVLKMGRKWKKYDLEIILISENPYLIYSGALPQFMGGFYEWHQTAINLQKLCERYQACESAGGIDQ